MKKIKKDKFLSSLDKLKLFFLYSLVFITPISKAGMEISFALVFLVWLIQKIFLKGIKIKEYLPQTKLTFPVFLFLSVCFLSIFNSVEPKESIKGFLGKWFQWAMIYFIFVDTIDSERRMTNVLKILSFSFTLMLLDGVYQLIMGKDFLRSFPLEGVGWITATFRSLNTFGGYLVLISPIVFCFLFSNLSKYSFRFFFLGIIPLFLLCFIFSYSASSWIALTSGLILIILYSKKLRMKYKVWFLSIPFLLIFIILFQPIFRERILTLPVQMDFNAGGRFTIWRDTLKEIVKNPLLGKGVNTTRSYVVKKYSTSPILRKYAHIHNLFLHFMLEIGILGLFAFLWIIWTVLKTVFSFIDKSYIFYGLSISFMGFLITNLVDTHIGEQIFGLFWVIIGIIMDYDKRWQKEFLR